MIARRFYGLGLLTAGAIMADKAHLGKPLHDHIFRIQPAYLHRDSIPPTRQSQPRSHGLQTRDAPFASVCVMVAKTDRVPSARALRNTIAKPLVCHHIHPYDRPEQNSQFLDRGAH